MPKSSRATVSKGAQLVQGFEVDGVVLQEHGLGDFQFKPAGVKFARRKDRLDDVNQTRAAELNRREIDRDADVVGPVERVEASLLQRPFAHHLNGAGLLGEGDELGGRDHAVFGMAPAHQGFA